LGSEERFKLALTAMAILFIGVLELIALMKGMDGKLMAIAFAAIALLAPSPVFSISWKNWRVLKGVKVYEEESKPKRKRERKKSV